MVAPRASWKGFIKFGEVSCPVALYTAASSSERISFNTLNRKTGNRVRREFVDGETGEPVEADDQVKGYEIEDGRYVVLEPEEVASAVPESDKTLKIEAFISVSEIDDIYFDKPYYLAPDPAASEVFALLRDGMRQAEVVAIARTVLFRRVRTLLIRPHCKGMIGTTLNFDYAVRSSDDAFDDLPDLKIEGEMLDLAEHIIATKKGTFDASAFDDRYEAAVADLVKAKMEGRTLPKRKPPAASKPGDLLKALRESAGVAGKARVVKAAAANADSGVRKDKTTRGANGKPTQTAKRRAG